MKIPFGHYPMIIHLGLWDENYYNMLSASVLFANINNQ